MAGFNKVIAIGTVAADPITETLDDATLSKFPIVTSRNVLLKDDTSVTEHCVFECHVWSPIKDFIKTGATLFVDGRLSMETFEEDGKKFNKMSLIVESMNELSYDAKKVDDKEEEESEESE